MFEQMEAQNDLILKLKDEKHQNSPNPQNHQTEKQHYEKKLASKIKLLRMEYVSKEKEYTNMLKCLEDKLNSITLQISDVTQKNKELIKARNGLQSKLHVKKGQININIQSLLQKSEEVN